MRTDKTEIPAGDIDAQRQIMARIREMNEAAADAPLAYIDTYGCQQNEADSETLRGILDAMGYAFTDDGHRADVIVINTCAVREHAETRVYGNIGALVHSKRQNPNQIIALCGCMVQQPAAAEKIRRSYRHVDLVFGPQALWRFPELFYRVLTERGRVFSIEDDPGSIAEGLPVLRDGGGVRAWLSIMYGCNNFCTYCIVPHVRGRERSRRAENIIADARKLVDDGCKDITLLGQNVNSYGRDTAGAPDFSGLLRRLNDVDGDFWLRFMTSHPKDAGERLFQAMAECGKVARHIHLPFQAGSDRVLAAMNRGYTQAHYLGLIDAARRLMPDLVVTSDVIVGFPGETEADFKETLRVLEAARFDALFTFIYSRRTGTPAADLPDPVPRAEKQRWFDALLELQNSISAQKHAARVGQTLTVLVDGASGDERYPLSARTNGGRLVRLTGEEGAIGHFRQARITDSSTWSLFGTLI